MTCNDCERYKLSASMWRCDFYKRAFKVWGAQEQRPISICPSGV